MPGWEHFEHLADIGVRGYGATVEEAFANAALALTAVITEPAQVRAEVAVPIDCHASDRDGLFFAWLNALVFEMATRHMLFSDFQVEVEDNRLHAIARGEEVDRARHQPAAEVKRATYTQLAVRRGSDGRWVAQCVVDV